MKKILLTLMVVGSFGAFAETVNLNCSQESSYFFQDKTSITLDGSSFLLRIDTDKKTLRTNFETSELGSFSLDIKYIEDGNSIIKFNIPMYP